MPVDEISSLCLRLLGDAAPAARAAAEAEQAGSRPERIARALALCRALRGQALASPIPPSGMAAAVAAELSAAASRLPQRQQEALALRDLMGLPHAGLAGMLGIDPAAVPALLGRARLRLRAELRGVPVAGADCTERERTLRTVILRQDGERVLAADQDWLVEHLGHCDGCRRVHASLLEAAACYRSWPVAAEPEAAGAAEAGEAPARERRFAPAEAPGAGAARPVAVSAGSARGRPAGRDAGGGAGSGGPAGAVR